MAEGANAGTIKARMILETDQFQRKIDQAKRDMDGLSKRGKMLDSAMKTAGTGLAVAGAAMAVGLGLAIKKGAEFEQQIAKAGAIAEASSAELAMLKNAAMDLGATTSKSASEVAVAMQDLAASGFDVNKIIGAMPGIISAAEASGENLARVSQVVAGALNAFQLEATEASRVADIMAMAANKSAASVDDMGYAFKYAAPVANVLGVSMEELAASVGIMRDASLEGSQAGTTLRFALGRLASPTKQGAQLLKELGIQIAKDTGEIRPFNEILADLGKALNGMSKQQKIAAVETLFGTEAMSGMIALIDAGPKKFDEFTNALRNSSGAAELTARKMKDNVAGAYEELSGSVETAAIKIYEGLSPALKKSLQDLTAFLNKLNSQGSFDKIGKDVGAFIEWLRQLDWEMIATVSKFTAGAGAVAYFGVKLTELLRLIPIFTRVLTLSTGPIGWIIGGLSLLGGLWASNALSVDKYNKAAEANTLEIAKQTYEIDKLSGSFQELRDKSLLTNESFARAVDIHKQLQSVTNEQTHAKLTKELEAIQKSSNLSNKEFANMLKLHDQIIEKAPAAGDAISKEGNKIANTTEKMRKYNAEKREMEKINLSNKIADGMSKLGSIMDGLQKKEAERVKLQREYSDISNSYQAKLLSVQELERQRVEAIQKGTQAYAEWDKLHGWSLYTQRLEVAEMQKKVVKGKEAVDQKNQEIGALQKQRQELLQNLATMRQLLMLQAQEVDQTLTSKDAVINKVKAFDAQIAKLKEIKTTNEADRQQINEQVTALEAKRDKLSTILGQLEQVETKQSEITGEAKKTNDELSKNVKKQVNASEIEAAKKKSDELNEKILERKTKQLNDKEVVSAGKKAEQLNKTLSAKATKPVNSGSIDGANKKADNLHRELSKPAEKKVTVWTTVVESVKQIFRHHGGPVPKFHSGGVFMGSGKVPGYGETNAKLMGGELVLTQLQQAKLWRIVNDATSISGSSKSTVDIKSPRSKADNRPINITLEMDKREMARVLVDPIDHEMKRNSRKIERAKGDM